MEISDDRGPGKGRWVQGLNPFTQVKWKFGIIEKIIEDYFKS